MMSHGFPGFFIGFSWFFIVFPWYSLKSTVLLPKSTVPVPKINRPLGNSLLNNKRYLSTAETSGEGVHLGPDSRTAMALLPPRGGVLAWGDSLETS